MLDPLHRVLHCDKPLPSSNNRRKMSDNDVPSHLLLSSCEWLYILRKLSWNYGTDIGSDEEATPHGLYLEILRNQNLIIRQRCSCILHAHLPGQETSLFSSPRSLSECRTSGSLSIRSHYLIILRFFLAGWRIWRNFLKQVTIDFCESKGKSTGPERCELARHNKLILSVSKKLQKFVHST